MNPGSPNRESAICRQRCRRNRPGTCGGRFVDPLLMPHEVEERAAEGAVETLERTAVRPDPQGFGGGGDETDTTRSNPGRAVAAACNRASGRSCRACREYGGERRRGLSSPSTPARPPLAASRFAPTGRRHCYPSVCSSSSVVLEKARALTREAARFRQSSVQTANLPATHPHGHRANSACDGNRFRSHAMRPRPRRMWLYLSASVDARASSSLPPYAISRS